MCKIKWQKGVSLAEMAIVMVIVGLLTAAVVGGVKLQKSAELRSVISSINSFKVAIDSFEHKYSDLPGDINDAHDYWGSACASSAADCNGDADGDIEGGGGPGANESLRSWQHLNLAGMVDGGYTGVGTASANNLAVPGVNVPSGQRSKLGYYLISNPSSLSGAYIIAGAYDAATGTGPFESIFTPAEAFSIDDKIDDGYPEKGKVRGFDGTTVSTSCINGTSPNKAYTVSSDEFECIIYFDAD